MSPKKNTLESLAAAGKAAAAESRTAAVGKLQTAPSASSSSTGPQRASAGKGSDAQSQERERLNLYLTGSDASILRDLRRMIVIETGDAASGNALILTALRALDL